jgi:hypothetical protein
MNTEYKVGHTFRTKCGRGRVAYRPDWYASCAWITYWNGVAELHFETPEEAAEWFKKEFDAELDLRKENVNGT